MANALFPKGKQGLLDETINMNSGDIRIMFVKSSYAYNAAHQYVADLGAVDNGRTGALTGKTFTNGVFDATDTSLNATAAVACGSLVGFKHTGNDATALLIWFEDTPALGLPFTPAAGQIVNIVHNNGASKIFAI